MTCSTRIRIEDVGRVLIRVEPGQRQPAAECHRRCRAGSWHCDLLSNSSVILNFHRTFPTHYSWLGICPLFSFIIDWFLFAALMGLVRLKIILSGFLFFRHFYLSRRYNHAQTEQFIDWFFYLFPISLREPLSMFMLASELTFVTIKFE